MIPSLMVLAWVLGIVIQKMGLADAVRFTTPLGTTARNRGGLESGRLDPTSVEQRASFRTPPDSVFSG